MERNRRCSRARACARWCPDAAAASSEGQPPATVLGRQGERPGGRNRKNKVESCNLLKSESAFHGEGWRAAGQVTQFFCRALVHALFMQLILRGGCGLLGNNNYEVSL